MRSRPLLSVALALALGLAACTPAPTTPPTATHPAPTSAPPTALPASAIASPAVSGTPPGVAPVPVAPVVGLPAGTAGAPWWNDTVFYEVFVRSFADSNGDGMGDLKGLIAKLDYLNDGDPQTTTDLGVSGLWLMPIQPSPSYHGYDITDYRGVNPQYGTREDFQLLMQEAHKRGIRVVLDLVLNHTSSQHPWFVAALDPSSPYRDWYLWSDTPGDSAWHASPTGTGYYYGLFWSEMPDLNYTNPAVTAEMEATVRYWLEDMGVDGFRLDAAKHLLEEGGVRENADSTHAWFKDFRKYYKDVNANSMTVGEVWSPTTVAAKYAQGDELDLTFDFDLAKALVLGARTGNVEPLAAALKVTLGAFPPNQFATFLTNHDQPRVFGIIGRRDDKARVAATLLLTAPGVPFLYYGEEIGMSGGKPDELIRTPMQWSAEDAGAGFTTGVPWEPANADYTTRNVAAQSADPTSLWAHYRALIGLRNAHVALRVGTAYLVASGHPEVYALLRSTPEETVLIVANLDEHALSAADYALTLEQGPLAGRYRVASLLAPGTYVAPESSATGGFSGYRPAATLAPFSVLILQLQAVTP